MLFIFNHERKISPLVGLFCHLSIQSQGQFCILTCYIWYFGYNTHGYVTALLQAPPTPNPIVDKVVAFIRSHWEADDLHKVFG